MVAATSVRIRRGRSLVFLPYPDVEEAQYLQARQRRQFPRRRASSKTDSVEGALAATKQPAGGSIGVYRHHKIDVAALKRREEEVCRKETEWNLTRGAEMTAPSATAAPAHAFTPQSKRVLVRDTLRAAQALAAAVSPEMLDAQNNSGVVAEALLAGALATRPAEEAETRTQLVTTDV
eukprot:CAMPEP_0197628988 /NCGR_PEP_ID=MMETSP1338-20131121/7044_1 /TAXON_ID=43686 ORGANISM="Pelagodinium beii, Strain RCC1491" /NCGR_SAMPLE_ID=MMETSP1338 /ASSEMBLY_ACC=CAM_ASM_000754 /LENGTH=177 /DNA_ID=CAMNT_0043199995 /DNA_START=57 /DNA_END=586 /DNA_ORIENTATION=+